MAKVKRNWMGLITIVVTIGIITYFAISDPNVKNLGSLLGRLNPLGLLGAVCCSLIYIYSESQILYQACKLVPGKMNFFQSVKSSIIGNYYSALTPFSTGGQPFQVAYMKKWDVPTGSSSSVLALCFFMWHICVTSISIIAYILYRSFIATQRGLSAACILGIFLSFIGVVAGGLLLSGLSLKKPLNFIKRILIKIKVIKNVEKVDKSLSNWINDFNGAIVLFKKYPQKAFGMLFLTLVKLISHCSVVYCIYRGFGLSMLSFWNVIFFQVLLTAAVAFVPLPGASGASEGVFYIIFGKIFINGTTFPAMLIWRGFTYYIYLLLGALLSIYDGVKNVGVNKEGAS